MLKKNHTLADYRLLIVIFSTVLIVTVVSLIGLDRWVLPAQGHRGRPMSISKIIKL